MRGSAGPSWLSTSNVLVTGGAGFIGCALSHMLAGSVGRWVALDVLHPQIHASHQRPAALHEAAELVIGDVTESAVWDGLLAGFQPDVVVHLAAETGTGQSLSAASRHALVNVVGTTSMLDAFSERGLRPRRMVLASSRAVYGEGGWRRSNGELTYPGQRAHSQLAAGTWDFPDAVSVPSSAARTAPNPTSVYGATKLAQEHLLRSWCGAFDIPLGILRLQNVYGPGQSLTNSYTGIVALFSRIARRGETIPLYEDGLVTRDFVFIDDVATALESLIAAPLYTLSLPFDIGSGEATSLMALATAVAELRGSRGYEITGRFRDGDVRHATCDISAAQTVLGWQPQWDLRKGLAALQTWIDEEDGRG